MARPLLAAALACAALVACSEARDTTFGRDGGLEHATGTTAAQCLSAGFGEVTYTNFAQSFFTTYCIRCHATNVTGDARNGAPTDHNFDSYAGATQFPAEMDNVAAMNPNGSVKNTFMPFSGTPLPTDAERQRLACWIAEGTLQ